MMSKKREAIFMGIGILAGLALSGPAAQAATASVTAAALSCQTIYVNGAQVKLEAYLIHGNNYVKLRDVAEAVGFNVYWDGAAVQIESDRPYTGEPSASQIVPPAQDTPSSDTGEYTISADHWSREDFSQQANPAVFTGIYDRALYNTIRQTLVDGEVGSRPAYTMVGDDRYSAVKNLLSRLKGILRYEHYVPKNFTRYYEHLDYFAVSAAMPENYREPYDFIQPVIQATAGMTDREKVEYLNDYLGALLTYKKGKTAGLARTFSPHSEELEAACGSYARAFKFLCAAADIPCITVSTNDHTWNLVYVDGQWLHVDAAANDLYRNHSVLLTETYPGYTDAAPEQTAFLKELLIPGSTK